MRRNLKQDHKQNQIKSMKGSHLQDTSWHFLNELTFVARDRTLVMEVSFWSLAKRKTPEIIFTQISNLRKQFAYKNFVSIVNLP